MISGRQFIIYGMLFASGTLIGYDSGYLNGVLGSSDFVRRYGIQDSADGTWYLTPRTRSLFTSLLVVGTLLGTITANFLGDWVGRKGSLLVAAIAYATGVCIQAAGVPVGAFVVGRILLGIGLGIISVVSPMYLVECSSSSTRGRLVALYALLLTSGNVLACGISYGTNHFKGAESWRITIAFQLLLALNVFLGAILAPESPVLLMKRNNPNKARQSLSILQNIPIDSSDLSSSIEEITHWLNEQKSHGTVHLLECFQGPNLRRQLLGIGMAILTIATGITFWFGYGTTFFMEAGIGNSYMISLILALVNAIFTAPSAYLVERLGRRTCLLWGGSVMAIAQLIPAIIHSVAPGSRSDHNALVAGAVIFIAAYATTWGTIGWVTMTEPYSQRLRLHQSTITMIIYWISTWLIAFVTPYLVDATAADLSIKVCYLWFGMVVVSLVWAFLYVPELSGLSVEEVDMLFELRIPAWRSVQWAESLRVVEVGEEVGIEQGGSGGGVDVVFMKEVMK
ncbi:glucose transporter [Aspergillus sclerotioniger CBS 115572]|uniref:Glucose transporter n=1 Tax=Aspergillus sclerotioniger CBS 115572 TaxID=1450535 RepID=A0A317WNR4_9EURO|nr:glucose transporter [Aspergillus sclerotioniger CBS 115572]PWY88114.1 glucose transporter [Aspergillus sclerotioniger CBS 115572]